jgi:hypothetical protein
VIDLCVMRVLHGESVASMSREAGVSRRALQGHVLRAQERLVKMAMGSRGCSREYNCQRYGREDTLHTEEARRVRLDQSQDQQRQREVLPFQDEYIYEVHRAPSDLRSGPEEMEVDSACRAPEEEGRTGACAATGEEEATRALKWATEVERYPRKRRKTTR